MYSVGTKIVHPFYGAGTIVRIQEKTIGASSNDYYVIDTVPGPREMRVMVPVNGAGDIGLRNVGGADELRQVLDAMCEPPMADDVVSDFRRRKSLITESLKSGSFEEVAEAVQMLYFMSTGRRLSMTDRAMLDQGKEMLAGELALATGTDLDRAMQEIEDGLSAMVSVEGD